LSELDNGTTGEGGEHGDKLPAGVLALDNLDKLQRNSSCFMMMLLMGVHLLISVHRRIYEPRPPELAGSMTDDDVPVRRFAEALPFLERSKQQPLSFCQKSSIETKFHENNQFRILSK
jgi:hypothetical protein